MHRRPRRSRATNSILYGPGTGARRIFAAVGWSRDTLTRRFGLALREARLKAGLTQEQLAHASGVHPTYVSQVERGLLSPTLTKLEAMAGALGTRPHQLLRAAERVDI